MELLIFYTLLYTSVLMLVAYGGMISERSGVINLGLEGIMVIGALAGTLVMRALPTDFPCAFLIVIAVSMLAGLLYSLLLAISAVSFCADQTLIGTAMNLLATAFAAVTARAINLHHGDLSCAVSFLENKTLMYADANMKVNRFWFVALLALIVLTLLLKKTRFGLRLVACGEHPQAAASVGIPVRKMRYLGVMISGALGGIGGIAYVTASVGEWNFENGVAGFGFLALAVMIFGQWNTWKIALAAIVFGLLRALSNIYTAFPLLEALHLPSAFYNILPYAICLLILVFFSKGSAAPKSAGIPYSKEGSDQI